MQITITSLTMRTGIDDLHSFIQKIIKDIESYDISFANYAESFFLIIKEALVNAMEHGNKWDPDKNISVSVQLDQTALYIIIADEGEGFCQLALAGSIKKNNKKGIRIIRKFCNPYWNDKGNIIYMKLPLSEQEVVSGSIQMHDIKPVEKKQLSKT